MKEISKMMWWERARLLTEKDKEAIIRAKRVPPVHYDEINPDWAETEAGRYEIEQIALSKIHRLEYREGMI